MINLTQWFLRYGVLPIGGGEEKSGGEDKDDKNTGGETVSKADFDAKVADLEKSKTDLEDMRMEVMTPEYLDFLNTSGEKKEDKGKTAEEQQSEDEDISKLSPKDVLARAKQETDNKIAEFKKGAQSDSDELTRKEVAAFARTHPDYKTYRPIMYGMSLDPKHKDLSLDELLGLAKDHVKGIHAETTGEEKVKQDKIKNEKPGGASESYEELKNLTPAEATKKAAEAVKAELGDMPAA